MKHNYVQYYVEGECEEKIIRVLKNSLRLIIPGKVQKLNVVESLFSTARLRTLNPKTMVVLVFDTDTGNIETLNRNLEILNSSSNVTEIVTIPQVRNFEEELQRSCNVKRASELLNSRSTKDFKSDFIQISNLEHKLMQHGFDIKLFWSQSPGDPYRSITNQSERVKTLH